MKKTVLAFAIICTNILFAQELTLEQAIELSLKNGKEIKKSGLLKENADLEIMKAFKTALPVVTYNGKYSRSEHSKRAMLDMAPNMAKDGFSQSIGVYQPLFRGGSIIGGILATDAAQEIAELSYLATKRDTRLNIISLYSNIMVFEKNKAVLNISKKELQERYKKQKEQLKLKLITKADLLKTEYSILELDAQIMELETNIAVAKKDMKLRLMLPENEELTLVSFDIPNNLTEGIDFEKDLQNALTNSLTAKLAEGNLKVAKAQKLVAASDFLPKVDAFVSYGNEREVHSFSNGFDNAEWRGGVTVKWDIFSFGSGIDNYREARNNQEIEQLNKESSQDNIKLQVTTNYRELKRMEQLKNSNQKAYEASKENFRIDTARYNSGLISTTDYLLSESQYRQSAVNYNASVLNYYMAFEKYRSSLI